MDELQKIYNFLIERRIIIKKDVPPCDWRRGALEENQQTIVKIRRLIWSLEKTVKHQS